MLLIVQEQPGSLHHTFTGPSAWPLVGGRSLSRAGVPVIYPGDRNPRTGMCALVQAVSYPTRLRITAVDQTALARGAMEAFLEVWAN